MVLGATAAAAAADGLGATAAAAAADGLGATAAAAAADGLGATAADDKLAVRPAVNSQRHCLTLKARHRGMQSIRRVEANATVFDRLPTAAAACC